MYLSDTKRCCLHLRRTTFMTYLTPLGLTTWGEGGYRQSWFQNLESIKPHEFTLGQMWQRAWRQRVAFYRQKDQQTWGSNLWLFWWQMLNPLEYLRSTVTLTAHLKTVQVCTKYDNSLAYFHFVPSSKYTSEQWTIRTRIARFWQMLNHLTQMATFWSHFSPFSPLRTPAGGHHHHHHHHVKSVKSIWKVALILGITRSMIVWS